jgi:phosphoribosylformylglycinamidine (FGAM) synthase-like enzyme
VLGEVTDTGRLVITWRGETIVDVDPSTVAVDGPVYERPLAYPSYQDELQADTAARLARPEGGVDLRDQVVRLMGSANLSDKTWVTNQYDRYVLGNTALSYPDDGGMVRVDETSGLGFAVATDANGRYCYLDPYRGAQLALAEAYRNVAVTGATPVAVSDCLNFGSPENPEVMWQFSQAVEGLADGCLELGIPVTGGNVSFYNQTGDVPIHPTPVVAVLGVIDDVARRVPSGWQDQGDNVYLLGTTSLELDGSAWEASCTIISGACRLSSTWSARRPSAGCWRPPPTRGSSTRRTTSPTAGSPRHSSRARCVSASACGCSSTTCCSATTSTWRRRCSASRRDACWSPSHVRRT